MALRPSKMTSKWEPPGFQTIPEGRWTDFDGIGFICKTAAVSSKFVLSAFGMRAPRMGLRQNKMPE